MVLARESNITGRVTVISLLLFLATVALASDFGERDPSDYFFTLTFGDLPEELELASNQKKIGMLLFFEADECPYCQYMINNVFNQIQIQEWYRKRFVNIAVDIHGDVEVIDFDGVSLPSKVFSDQRDIYLTPAISFIDLNGVEVYRHLGMIKTPEEFLLLGKYIEEKQYLNTKYKAYLESHGMPDDDENLTTPTAVGDAM